MIKGIIGYFIIVIIVFFIYKQWYKLSKGFRIALIVFTGVFIIYSVFFGLKVYAEITGHDILGDSINNLLNHAKNWVYEKIGLHPRN